MTLRIRLLLAVGTLTVVLLITAFIVNSSVTSYLVAQLDQQLDRFIAPASGETVAMPPQLPPPGASSTSLSSLFIGRFDGPRLTTVLAPNLDEESAAVPAITREAAEGLARSGGHASVESSVTGTSYRIVARDDVATGTSVVVIGIQLGDVDAAVGRLTALQIAATGLVIALLSLVTWWVLRLGVRPVRQMTVAASQVAAGDLELRIPEAPDGTEAAQLGAALNTMLGRFESAFSRTRQSEERLRRFLADASHELRTPVTTVRGYAELYRLGGLRGAGELDGAMVRVEAESVRMGRLVEDLLRLARLDDGQRPERSSVDLAEVVREQVADLAVVEPGRVVLAQVESATVRGVSDHLHQVVANLLRNAVVHTPPTAPITVALSGGALSGTAVFVVTDRGPGMRPVDRERAFERFYRADPSRSRSSGGSGLGLAIVDAIVRDHGGTVTIEPTDETDERSPGITVTVTLPLLMDRDSS